MVRLLIADDHPIVRRGMIEIVSRESDFSVVGEACDVNQVMEILTRQPVDILLLDLNMPGKHGLDAIKEILARFRSVRILVMSAYPEDQFATRVLRAGALGYLSKDAAPAQLVTALRKVALGGRYITETTAEQLAADAGAGTPERPHEILSDRELQVLLHIAAGKTVSEIADLFSLSPKTVSTYRSRILEKLNLKSNADIARYAIDQKLIDARTR